MPYFFNNFPDVKYDVNKNDKFQTVKNILLRYQFRDFPLYKNKTSVFYQHNVEEGQRPDIIAERYYKDASLHWIVLITNNIIDPYYDWPLDYTEFQNYVREKYRYQGSLVC
jgi:hypothetical protein